eukprot:scaffold109579_cov26-Tisochrysis_lutea.AAC.3
MTPSPSTSISAFTFASYCSASGSGGGAAMGERGELAGDGAPSGGPTRLMPKPAAAVSPLRFRRRGPSGMWRRKWLVVLARREVEHRKHRIVHNLELAKKGGVGLNLLAEQLERARWHGQLMPPIEVLQCAVGIGLFGLGGITTKSRALQVILFVDRRLLGHEIVHHDHPDVAANLRCDTDQPVEAWQQR